MQIGFLSTASKSRWKADKQCCVIDTCKQTRANRQPIETGSSVDTIAVGLHATQEYVRRQIANRLRHRRIQSPNATKNGAFTMKFAIYSRQLCIACVLAIGITACTSGDNAEQDVLVSEILQMNLKAVRGDTRNSGVRSWLKLCRSRWRYRLYD